MLGVDHNDVNACGDWCTEFGRFWTESLPTFFTETVPQAFQTAWDAVAEWIDTCVKPFFESCHEWFVENAEWLWPVAIGVVAAGALVAGIVLPLVLCQNNSTSDPQPGEGKGAPRPPVPTGNKAPISAPVDRRTSVHDDPRNKSITSRLGQEDGHALKLRLNGEQSRPETQSPPVENSIDFRLLEQLAKVEEKRGQQQSRSGMNDRVASHLLSTEFLQIPTTSLSAPISTANPNSRTSFDSPPESKEMSAPNNPFPTSMLAAASQGPDANHQSTTFIFTAPPKAPPRAESSSKPSEEQFDSSFPSSKQVLTSSVVSSTAGRLTEYRQPFSFGAPESEEKGEPNDLFVTSLFGTASQGPGANHQSTTFSFPEPPMLPQRNQPSSMKSTGGSFDSTLPPPKHLDTSAVVSTAAQRSTANSKPFSFGAPESEEKGEPNDLFSTSLLATASQGPGASYLFTSPPPGLPAASKSNQQAARVLSTAGNVAEEEEDFTFTEFSAKWKKAHQQQTGGHSTTAAKSVAHTFKFVGSNPTSPVYSPFTVPEEDEQTRELRELLESMSGPQNHGQATAKSRISSALHHQESTIERSAAKKPIKVLDSFNEEDEEEGFGDDDSLNPTQKHQQKLFDSTKLPDNFLDLSDGEMDERLAAEFPKGKSSQGSTDVQSRSNNYAANRYKLVQSPTEEYDDFSSRYSTSSTTKQPRYMKPSSVGGDETEAMAILRQKFTKGNHGNSYYEDLSSSTESDEDDGEKARQVVPKRIAGSLYPQHRTHIFTSTTSSHSEEPDEGAFNDIDSEDNENPIDQSLNSIKLPGRNAAIRSQEVTTPNSAGSVEELLEVEEDEVDHDGEVEAQRRAASLYSPLSTQQKTLGAALSQRDIQVYRRENSQNFDAIDSDTRPLSDEDTSQLHRIVKKKEAFVSHTDDVEDYDDEEFEDEDPENTQPLIVAAVVAPQKSIQASDFVSTKIRDRLNDQMALINEIHGKPAHTPQDFTVEEYFALERKNLLQLDAEKKRLQTEMEKLSARILEQEKLLEQGVLQFKEDLAVAEEDIEELQAQNRELEHKDQLVMEKKRASVLSLIERQNELTTQLLQVEAQIRAKNEEEKAQGQLATKQLGELFTKIREGTDPTYSQLESYAKAYLIHIQIVQGSINERIVQTLTKYRNWINGGETVEGSIANLNKKIETLQAEDADRSQLEESQSLLAILLRVQKDLDDAFSESPPPKASDLLHIKYEEIRNAAVQIREELEESRAQFQIETEQYEKRCREREEELLEASEALLDSGGKRELLTQELESLQLAVAGQIEMMNERKKQYTEWLLRIELLKDKTA